MLTHFLDNVSLHLGEDGKRRQGKGVRIVFDTNAIVSAILPKKVILGQFQAMDLDTSPELTL